jgi:hypothetical protein
MNARVSLSTDEAAAGTTDSSGSPLLKDAPDGLLDRLLQQGPAIARSEESGGGGLVICELLALTDNGNTALLAMPGREAQATPALSVVDLHGAHIGMRVAVAFESSGARRPIVMGVLRGQEAWPLESKPVQVDVDVDGQRMVISANEQLVLRCGRASITLTKAGKVLIEGSYLLSHSSGANRIKGGSVQLN